MIRTLIMVLVALSMVFINTSCNMLRGAGQDIEKVGDSIKDAAS